MMQLIDPKGLIAHLRAQFRIDWHGHHGIAHWVRARANGLMLSDETGANRHLVELFTVFHAVRRVNECQHFGFEQGVVRALIGSLQRLSIDRMQRSPHRIQA